MVQLVLKVRKGLREALIRRYSCIHASWFADYMISFIVYVPYIIISYIQYRMKQNRPVYDSTCDPRCAHTVMFTDSVGTVYRTAD